MKVYATVNTFDKTILGLIFVSSLLIPVLLYVQSYKLLILVFAIPIFCYILLTFESNFRFYFIFSIFFAAYIYVNARIQLVNIISYILILFFIINHSSNQFNKYNLPILFRCISILLVGAVFLSSINTPFISFWSVYYGFMFFTYIFTGYIVYKSVRDAHTVQSYLNYFYKSVGFFSIVIILQILITGKIRSFGISGPSVPDVITIALLIVIFKSYLLGRITKIDLSIMFVIFITLITTLSRFAWIGFVSSLFYGMFMVSLLHSKKLFSKKTIYLLTGLAAVMLIIFITGLHQTIISRFLDVDLTVLDTTREQGAVSNSLDTRALIWVTALNAFLHNKFTGVGYFMFHKVSENYNVIPQGLFDDIVFGLDAHSTFLNFLAETGILGLSMLLLFLFLAFYYSFKSIKLSLTEESKNTSILLNILVFFVITTSIYSGAFTFGYNG